ERAVAADPTLSLAYGMRAHIRCQLAGDDALVDADWARALELAPDDVATIYHRALWLAEKERYAAAFDDFDRVVRLAPSLAQGYFQRGHARYRLDEEPPEGAWLETAEEIDARFGACIDDFERAIALGYEDEDVFAQLHWSHKCLDDDAKALDALDRGLALDPRRHDLLMLREDLRRELGDEAGAEADRLLREEVVAEWKVEEEAEAAAVVAGM